MKNNKKYQDQWEGFQGHPHQDQKSKQEQEGFFTRHTRPTGPPRANLNQVPFEKWDWAKNDPGFYNSFKNMPEYQMKEHYNQIKWRRWNLATRDSGQVRYDFRPHVFFKKMKLEIFLLCGGIFMGFMLPTLTKRDNSIRNTA